MKIYAKNIKTIIMKLMMKKQFDDHRDNEKDFWQIDENTYANPLNKQKYETVHEYERWT